MYCTFVTHSTATFPYRIGDCRRERQPNTDPADGNGAADGTFVCSFAPKLLRDLALATKVPGGRRGGNEGRGPRHQGRRRRFLDAIDGVRHVGLYGRKFAASLACGFFRFLLLGGRGGGCWIGIAHGFSCENSICGIGGVDGWLWCCGKALDFGASLAPAVDGMTRTVVYSAVFYLRSYLRMKNDDENRHPPPRIFRKKHEHICFKRQQNETKKRIRNRSVVVDFRLRTRWTGKRRGFRAHPRSRGRFVCSSETLVLSLRSSTIIILKKIIMFGFASISTTGGPEDPKNVSGIQEVNLARSCGSSR